MNRRSQSLFLAITSAAAVSAAIFGCSSSSGGGGNSSGGYSSSLPSDQSAGNLSDSDFQMFCSSAEAYVFQQIANPDTACEIVGVAAAAAGAIAQGATNMSVQQACTNAFNACKMAQSTTTPTPTADAGTSNISCQKPTGNCTATVGQIESCVNDIVTALKAASCSNVTLQSVSTTGNMSGGSTACNAATQACPGFVSQLTTPTP